MMPNPLLDIRIGTMVRANLDDPAAYIKQILPLGFESIQPFFWQTLGGKDVRKLAAEIRDAIGNADVVVSSVAMFGKKRSGRRNEVPLVQTVPTGRHAMRRATPAVDLRDGVRAASCLGPDSRASARAQAQGRP